MSLTDNPFVKNILNKTGPIWDPTILASQQGDDSVAGFAVDFIKFISPILSNPSITNRCPNLKIDFVLVENSAVNGFAGKISENNENYLLGIFSGTITKLYEIFSKEEYLLLLRQGLGAMSKLSNWELRQNSLFFSSLFLTFHEFGHVFRGHLNYSSATVKLEAFAWMESQTEAPANSDEHTERRHLSECDADAFAGMMLGGQVQDYAKNISNNLDVSISDIRDDVTIIAATAIHFLFCLFDSKTKNSHPYYPLPHIRSAIVHAHMATQLYKEGVGEREALLKIIHGFQRAEAIKNGLGMRKSSFDLEKEFSAWNVKYKNRLTNLSKILVDFSPCNR